MRSLRPSPHYTPLLSPLFRFVLPTRQRFFDAFMGAAQQGNLEALEGLFATDVVSPSDGGGLVRAARRPVVGRARVAGFIAKVAEPRASGWSVCATVPPRAVHTLAG